MHPTIETNDQKTCDLRLASLLPQLQDYIKPNSLLFFVDFTVSCLIGNSFLWVSAKQDFLSFPQFIFAFASALALFRASTFIHEISHSAKSIKWFPLYYNVLHGFLHKAPTYIYNSHRHHHMPRTYGTLEDPEYDNLGNRSFFYTFVFSPFILMLVSPIFLAIRWSIIPFLLPFIGNDGRKWVFAHISTLVMNLKYVRPEPTESEKREWYFQDTACAFYSVITVYLFILGILPWSLLVSWYLAAYMLSITNYIRVLLNHRYLTNFENTTHKQQIIDSVTYPLNPINFFFYPVGLGYHALHHMFPQIPYHNIGKAHRLLMNELPDNHPYRVTVIKGFLSGIRQLVKRRF